MTPETLTFHSVDVRAVVLKLRRPVVARVATMTEWPLILIDLKTEEGVVGRSYLEPYIVVKPPPARRAGSVAGVTGACVCDASGVRWLRVG